MIPIDFNETRYSDRYSRRVLRSKRIIVTIQTFAKKSKFLARCLPLSLARRNYVKFHI